MKMMFEPGDIQVIYNHTLFHDRMSYEDYDDQSKKRHLLRLWISAYEDRELSPDLKKHNQSPLAY